MPTGKDLNISLTVTDANGQQATDDHFVRNLFEGGGPCTECPDNTLDSFAEQTDKLKTNQILAFPNPSSSSLNILLPTSFVESNVKLQIIDFNGVVIIENRNTKTKQQLQTIDISILKQGVYLLRVISNNTVKTIKFIKK